MKAFFIFLIPVRFLFTYMPRLIIEPDIEDIRYFKVAGQNKSKNDEHNKIRENVIANLFNIDNEFFDDQTYGEDWRLIYDKFNSSVSTLCEVPFSSIGIKPMGGMSYNYDFLLSFADENKNIVKKAKLEFKHNNANVSDLVQFLELYDKDCKYKFELCQVSYAEFYYDNYLDKYLDVDDELIYEKPEKDIYLSKVSDIKYKHKFFQLLHEKKNNKIKEKQEIANESIKKYLELYTSSFNFNKILEKIKESQSEKVFLLWDCENFHIQTLDIENITISGIKKIHDLYFDISVENFIYDIRVRLNWGNNNGLANPRWKFSFIQK